MNPNFCFHTHSLTHPTHNTIQNHIGYLCACLFMYYVQHDNLLKVLMIWCIKFVKCIVYVYYVLGISELNMSVCVCVCIILIVNHCLFHSDNLKMKVKLT